MDLMEAMRARHSVRQYTDRPLEAAVIEALRAEAEACSREGDLRIQFVTNEPEAFTGFLAHYGSFRGVTDYIALVGADAPDLQERCGWYGERLVLRAQQLGLNTCWVALTFSKKKSRIEIRPGEKLVCVIALGYGANQGVPHRDKPMEKLCSLRGPMPDWFRRGMEAAMLAPTAVNQQKFRFTLEEENGVRAEATGGRRSYSLVDLGIVKYHFETGAGKSYFHWL